MSDENTALERVQNNGHSLISHDSGEYAMLMDTAKFEHAWRVSNLFASSDLVPAQYKGKPQNCFIALQQASRLHCDPMMFMQNTYIVHGTPGMEGKLAIALINSRGPFRGPIRWEYDGEGEKRKCRAWAIDKETGDKVYGTWITWQMVKDEGWISNKKWKTMTDQMFAYRSAVFFARAYAPECLLGMSTLDEIEDMAVSGDIRPVVEADDLNSRLGLSAVEEAEDAVEMAAEEGPSDLFGDPSQLTDEEREEYGIPPEPEEE